MTWDEELAVELPARFSKGEEEPPVEEESEAVSAEEI